MHHKLLTSSRLLLVVVLTLGLSSIFAQFGGGSGTEADPYQVATAEHLNNVRNYLSSHFIQTADIDLNIAPYNTGEGWQRIGVYGAVGEDIPFTGKYDGGGFAIANLYINRPSTDYQALFAIIRAAELTNIRLTNINITAYTANGALVVQSESDNIASVISNCSVDGVMNCYNLGGGLVSRNFYSIISNCYSAVNVTGNNMIGGLLATNDFGTVSNSYATGSCTGNSWVAGLVGNNWNSTITNSFSTGHVTGTGSYVGGLMGSQTSCTTTNSYWDTQTSGQTSSAGGEGRTTDEMTYPYAANTYVGWNFETIWGADVNGSMNSGYPYLQAFESNLLIVHNPTFSPEGGAFPDPLVDVTLQTITPDAIIYYTLDGSDPTEQSALYTSPIPLDLNNGPVTIKARGYLEGWEPSGVVSATYTALVADPVFTPDPAFYTQPVLVQIATSTPGAAIYYTLNGTNPTEQSPEYTEPFSIDTTVTIKAKAFKQGFAPSQIITASYFIYVDVTDETVTPLVPELLPASPNPFSLETSIQFKLTENSNVELGIYDLRGRLIRSVEDGYFSKGLHKIQWDGKDSNNCPMPNGIYFIQALMADKSHTIKIIKLK
jgi:hypothetical protein